MGELKGQLFAVLAVVIAFSLIGAFVATLLEKTAKQIDSEVSKVDEIFEGQRPTQKVDTTGTIKIIYLEY